MSIESAITNLNAQTAALLNAVNVSKDSLDQMVLEASTNAALAVAAVGQVADSIEQAAADRVQTGLDRVAADASVVAAALEADAAAVSAANAAEIANFDPSTKANVNSPIFTGEVGGITSAMVGLGSVTNTTDGNKPVSTAQAAAIAGERTAEATLTNKTLTNPTNTEQILVDAATTAWNMDLGHVARWVLNASRTLAAPTNYKVGGQYMLHLRNTNPASFAVTWPAGAGGIQWPYGTAPDLTTSNWTVITLVWSVDHDMFLGSYTPGY